MAADAQPTSNIEIDDSLMWINYMDSAQKVPGQVLYEEITCDSCSTSGFTFNFRSPADNALLDNEVIIEYPLKITKANLADTFRKLGKTVVSSDRMLESFIAPRQCFPVARSIQNLSVTINGSNFNVQPVYWCDILNRLYFSEEDAKTFCSTSGGQFDSADPRHTAPWRLYRCSQDNGTAAIGTLDVNVGGVPLAADHYAINAPLGSELVGNKGLFNRFESFLNSYYQNYCLGQNGSAYDWGYDDDGDYEERPDDTDANRQIRLGRRTRVDVGGDTEDNIIYITMYERIPIAPFVFHPSKDPRMSIPNIKQINITAQFVTNYLIDHIFQGDANGITGGNSDLIGPTDTCSIAFTNSNAVKLHCKWRLTDMAIPPVIRIPAPKYLQYIQALTLAGPETDAARYGPYDLGSHSFANIQLDAIPDKFFIYVKRATSAWEMCFPSEFQLSIKSITLTIGGSSGRLTSLKPAQMYDNFLKHSAHGGENKLRFDDWYRYRCCAILEASDIGLIAGAGYNYKTNLTVKAELESYWDITPLYNSERVSYVGNENTQYDFIVLCQYNHHWVELNSSGGSKSGMTMVPRL